jgi:hypothetical protein
VISNLLAVSFMIPNSPAPAASDPLRSPAHSAVMRSSTTSALYRFRTRYRVSGLRFGVTGGWGTIAVRVVRLLYLFMVRVVGWLVLPVLASPFGHAQGAPARVRVPAAIHGNVRAVDVTAPLVVGRNATTSATSFVPAKRASGTLSVSVSAPPALSAMSISVATHDGQTAYRRPQTDATFTMPCTRCGISGPLCSMC